jgi:hypothetical protein
MLQKTRLIVVPGGKLQNGVVSRIVGGYRMLVGCGRVFDDHFCSGDDCPLRIFHGSRDPTGIGICARTRAPIDRVRPTTINRRALLPDK